MRSSLESLRNGLIVSCQAFPGEPLRIPGAMRIMAQSVLQGGADGILAQGLGDVRDIRTITEAPLVGLWKDGEKDDVYITPTAAHAVAVAEAGADLVAVDATRRPRPDARPLSETIRAIHTAGRLVLADISTEAEARTAADEGADVVSTCLAGYTSYTGQSIGPDIVLVERLATILDIPVIAEGRIRTPREASEALKRGAHAVVVGRAITNPIYITRNFISDLKR